MGFLLYINAYIIHQKYIAIYYMGKYLFKVNSNRIKQSLLTLLYFAYYWVWTGTYALREKCPYSELLWFVFSRIRTENREILCISLYSVRIWKNTDQNNSKYRHILLSDARKVWFHSVGCFTYFELTWRIALAGAATPRGKRCNKKGKQRKKKTFKIKNIEMLSTRSICYCFRHSGTTRIQKNFLSAKHGGRQYLSVFHGPSSVKSISLALSSFLCWLYFFYKQ